MTPTRDVPASSMAVHRVVAEGEPGGPVPATVWTPARPDPGALMVLLGHGRGMDKDSQWLAALAQRFTARGWNVVAIDASGHGERRPLGATDWPRPDPDTTRADWAATLDAVAVQHELSTDSLGYWGISMGAALGVSLVRDDPRFRAAVLGHMHADWPHPPGRRLRNDARALGLPVLFLANWDDASAPRAGALELYGGIGSADKRLLNHPGGHAQLPDEALAFSEAFLARHA